MHGHLKSSKVILRVCLPIVLAKVLRIQALNGWGVLDPLGKNVHDEVMIALVDLVFTDVLTLVRFLLDARLAYSNVKCLPDSWQVDSSIDMVPCDHHEDLTYPRHLVSLIHGTRIFQPNFLLAVDGMSQIDCSEEDDLRSLIGFPY